MTDHDHDHDEHGHDDHDDTHHHDGPHDYVGAVQGFRAEKDEFFKTNTGSPIPEERARRVHGPAVLPGRTSISSSRA